MILFYGGDLLESIEQHTSLGLVAADLRSQSAHLADKRELEDDKLSAVEAVSACLFGEDLLGELKHTAACVAATNKEI